MTDEHGPEDVISDSPNDSGTDSGTATATAGFTIEEGVDDPKKEKLTQKVEIKDIGPCKKHIKVSVDREPIEKRLKEKFSEIVKKSNVAGFRPGKAPSKLVERRYRTEVSDQVKIEVLYASLEQMADETDLAPLSQPEINPEKIVMPKEGPFVYEFEVEVRPEFDVPEYRGLKLKRPSYTFTDADIQREELRLLQSYGQVVPKDEGNAQIGDIIVGDALFKDGAIDLNEVKEVQFRVEKKLALQDALAPKFAEQVQGVNSGQKRVVDLQVSSQAANVSLRGKAITMEFTVKDVKTIRLPEVTEEFLHETFKLSRIEQLRELIKVSLERRLEYAQRQSARQQVASHIAASANLQLPEDLLVRQARRALGRKVMEMRSEGIPEEEIATRFRLMQQDILQSTAASLKEHFVLQKIAEMEKIEVNEDDIEDEIERLAEQSDESARRIRARLEKEEQLDILAAQMIERRTLDLILDSAVYEDVPVDEDLQPTTTTSAAQAVPGEMRNLEAEAAESAKAAETPSSPPQS